MFFSSHLLEAISHYRVVYTHNLELAKNFKDEEFITINWHVNIECDIKTVARHNSVLEEESANLRNSITDFKLSNNVMTKGNFENN